MKMYLSGLSVLVLAVSALALPLTDASDPAQRQATSQGSLTSQRRDTVSIQLAQSSIQLAQASPVRSDSSQRKAAADAATDREQAASSAVAKVKRQAPVTTEMEAEVRKFVSEHHRELVEVLARLKGNVPEEYERAVRDLNRNRLRLQQFEGRDRYADELELWKALSRARLLGAKVQMGNDAALREKLSETLATIYDLRAKLVQQDRDRAVERLKKLDEQLETLWNDRDENLQKQFIALTKTTQNRPKPVATKNARGEKPAASPKTPVKKSSAQTIE